MNEQRAKGVFIRESRSRDVSSRKGTRGIGRRLCIIINLRLLRTENWED